MPPKIDIATLIGKKNVAVDSLYELFEEFDAVFDVEPEMDTLEPIYKQVEAKYRNVKKQQETIADKIVESGLSQEEDIALENKKAGEQVKSDYLQVIRKFAAYQKKCNAEQESIHEEALEAMSSAVKKMADSLTKPRNTSHGIEKLTVPTWDGKRRSYATWKQEFQHWMEKYSQDEDERLQRFRKALPRNSWWTDQVRTCKTIDKAWKILDVEFLDKRKLMDELLADVNSYKTVRRDSKSLTRYATVISTFVNDMEDNGCQITNATEAPFVMSQLLSKLDIKDNTEFGREMYREKKEESVSNLVEWLQIEARLRSRGKKDSDAEVKGEKTQSSYRKTEGYAVNTTLKQVPSDECPLGCTTKHLLFACPKYHNSTVDQRWQVVKQHKRCRKCLLNHHTDNCRKTDGTTCDKCNRRHHRSLHNERNSSTNLNPNATSFISSNQETDTGSVQRENSKKEETQETDTKNVQGSNLENNIIGLCPVQKIKIRDKEGSLIDALAMIDSGSNTSFISKKTAQKLGLTGLKTHLKMNLAGGKKNLEESEQLEVTVMSPTDKNVEKTLQVYTISNPCSPAKTVSRKSVESYSHLQKVSGEVYLSGGKIDVLIGTNFAEAFLDIHVISGNAGDPIAKKNCFGWYVLGQFEEPCIGSPQIDSIDVGRVSAIEDVKKLLIQDMLGVKPTEMCTCTDNVLKENKFVKSLERSTRITDGRVQIRMPWKDTGPPKKSNYDLALKRMYSTETSFKKKDCFPVIEAEVQKLLDQGFVIEVPNDQVHHDRKEWYLPLHAVFTPDRSTKVRLVFDASAKGHDGFSLNDHLEKGPNYINSLPNVLMAWRWDATAYCGDIRKMFNQILIHPDDQVFHRFLWRRDTNEKPTVYQWIRLNFGDKPAPDIATNSIFTLAKASPEFPEAAAELREHSYVDDIGGSRENSSKVKQITNEIDAILSKGQFQIKEWHSNDKEVDRTNERHTKFLGQEWDKEKDVIKLKKNEITGKTRNFSKRSCLTCLAQLWDPIGLLSPVTIKYRIDLQELWYQGYSWDEVLPDDIQTKWVNNVQEMDELLNITFERKLKPANALGLPQIHGFCDGGELAYGAVIFLRWTLEDGKYCCIPVITKTFVAPLKKKSIPRLELMGCLTLSRIYDTCKEALKFMKIDDCKKVFWVDSLTVLSWLRNSPRKFKPFVSARVAEIQETLDVENFAYIKSKRNPADALTRGISASQLMKWMEGPTFLKIPENEWPVFQETPKCDNSVHSDNEVLKEMKSIGKSDKLPKSEADCNPIASESTEDNEILDHLLKTCSSFRKVRKTLAYVLRFVQNAKSKIANREVISVRELKDAENLLFKWSQRKIDPNTLDKKLIAQIDQDGLLRAHGRLEDIRSLPKEMRNPIILPRNHQLVNLLLLHLHEARAHCGYKSLMHETKKRFWIIGLRSAAKLLNRKCVTCRKLRKKPLEQLMGQVPSLRVAAGFPAFINTAMDLFGPLKIKLNRKTLKDAQVIIFTCMTTRAIHLELVSDKSTDTFLMAFRRFACTRGHPSVCWSDCGTNFVGAQGYLREIMQKWDFPKIKSILSEDFTCDFRWEWNVPRASHQNGVVESLIKSVRQALDVTCKLHAYTEEQWRTFLSEITYIINDRPLYPSSDDIFESPPITPNDILLGHHNPPPQAEPEKRVNPRDLLRNVQKTVQDFWETWIKYFAPNLLPRNKWFKTRDNIQIGDLVLELDQRHRRNWKMALIVDVYPGKDGRIRKVKIKTANGDYDRPIHKLCLIATKEELQNEH